MIQELKRIIRSFLLWILSLIVISAAFFVPLGERDALSVAVFKIMSGDLLPSGVELVVTNPLSAFLVQMGISLFLAFVLALPILFFRLIKYLYPALYKKERRALFKVLIPSSVLFLAGAAFAYFIIIPTTFRLLYPFAEAFGATTYFLLNDFVHLVLGMVVVVGVIFLLPVFMFLLSYLGVVPGSFWRDGWRYALVFFLVFSAIITPDGTGITMLMLSLPLSALYFLGALFAIRVEGESDYK